MCGFRREHANGSMERPAVGVVPEEPRVRAQDVPHGLPLHEPVPDGGAHLRGRLVVGVDARAAVHERAAVRGLGPVREVEPLHERARPLPLAPVADERGPGEALADGLAEIGACLEAARLVLRKGLVVRRPVRRARAGVELRAEAVRASVALVAGYAVVQYLPPDRRRGLAERARDPRDALVGLDPELDLPAHCRVHVLCHVVFLLLFLVCRLRQVGHPPARLGRNAEMIPNQVRLMEVNATSLPGEGGRENPHLLIPAPVSSTQRKYHIAFTSGNDAS